MIKFKFLKLAVLSLFMLPAFFTFYNAAYVQTAAAQEGVPNCPENKSAGTDCLTLLPEVKANDASLKNILTIVFGIAAGLAVLTIVIAAFNFATAEGDPEKVSRSKSAIVYALIGLAIALLAEAIVQTALGSI